jgi:hypothetical protein
MPNPHTAEEYVLPTTSVALNNVVTAARRWV